MDKEQIGDEPIDKRLILSAIENMKKHNSPTYKKEIDILDKNNLGKIKFGQKLKKTFLKTGQGFVFIEETNSSSLPDCSTVNQLTSEAINESENAAPHEMSSVNIDALDITIHEEKMPRKGPEFLCKLQIQEKHKCPICFKGFESKVNIKRHFQEIHEKKKPVEIRPHESPPKAISGIEQSPSNVPEKPFQCSLCPKAFKLNSVLKKHFTQVHDKIKPFHCSF